MWVSPGNKGRLAARGWRRVASLFVVPVLVTLMAAGLGELASVVPAAAAGTGLTTVTVSATPAVSAPGGQVQLSALVAPVSSGPTPTGSAQFFISGSQVGSTDCTAGNGSAADCLNSSGAATAELSGLADGSYTVYASYSGDANYARVSYSNSVPFTITVTNNPVDNTTTTLALSPSTIAMGQTVSLNAQVVDQNNLPVTSGTVTFFDTTTNTLVGTAGLNANGDASFSAGGWGAGDHTVQATFVGPITYGPSGATQVLSVTGPVAIDNTTTTLALSPSTITPGQTVGLNAQVVDQNNLPVTSGTVTFFDETTNTLIGTANLNANGDASFSEGGWGAGDHTVQATFAGPITYGPSGATQVLAVTNPIAIDNTTTTLTMSPASIVAGQTTTLSAQVLDQNNLPVTSGTVTFFDDTTNTLIGTANLNNSGVASFSEGGWVAGNQLIEATFVGPVTYGPSGVSGQLNVLAAAATTTTTITNLSPGQIVSGQKIDISAAVVSNGATQPSGLVTFYADGSPIGSATLLSNGTTTLSYTGPWVTGTHEITATYGGDSLDAASLLSNQVPLNVVAGPDTSSTVASATPLTSEFGSSVTLAATVSPGTAASGTPTGTVTFNLASATGSLLCQGNLSGGVASCATSSLPLGDDTVVASYGGDSGHTGSMSTFSVSITPSGSATDISVTPSPATYGASVTLSAEVASANAPAGTPTGTVTFSLGSATGPVLCSASLALGAASCPTTALVLGIDTVVASYGGDTNHLASSSSTSETITPSGSATDISVTPSPATYGASVTLSAEVASANAPAGTPTGT
ncbi:MAG: beta strand repeat-containing protein, partial [Acidimicrobiales bacterium]